MSLAKYDKYIDSGVDWLGNIPEQWELKRIKDLGEYQSGEYINALEFVDDGYPIYGGNGFRGFASKYNHNGEYILMGRQGALCGNINYARGKFWATEHAVVVYKKNKINAFWYGELLRIMNLNQYSLSAAQPGLSVEKIKRLELPYVQIAEQTAIATYLDLKTSTIDRKVFLLERKITYYQQLRKSLINETVCRGLDKNAKLKDSGIEWIGRIPEHWEVKRLKNIGYLYSGLSGKSGDDFNQEESSLSKFFIPFTNIANNQFINIADLRTVLMGKNESQNKVRVNDLFFLMSSENFEDLGKTALLAEDIKDTYLNSFCKGFRITNKQTFPVFINYLLNSKSFKERLSNEGKGFTRINLKMEKVTDFNIIAPPKTEQAAISSFLDQKTQKIDSIVTNIKSQIETLKELRKTLINDVVTGKIKVTN